MTLVDLIKALKEELKHGDGDRELRPDVTVQSILAPAAPATDPISREWSDPAEAAVWDSFQEPAKPADKPRRTSK